jgi:RNA polymerase sigma factor (sigma-70 family)
MADDGAGGLRVVMNVQAVALGGAGSRRAAVRRRAVLVEETSFAGVLAAAQQREPWALQQLFEELGPAVAGYLRAQRAAEPDDLANEVFLRAFRGIDTFAGEEASFRSWIFTIAHNVLVDDVRRAQRRPVVVDLRDRMPPLQGGDAEQDAMRALAHDDVQARLGCLTEDQRTVVLLRVVADLTLQQIAQATGKRVGAVKATQRRALEALRRDLSA